MITFSILKIVPEVGTSHFLNMIIILKSYAQVEKKNQFYKLNKKFWELTSPSSHPDTNASHLLCCYSLELSVSYRPVLHVMLTIC